MGRLSSVHQCIVGGVVKDAKQLVVFGTNFQQRRYIFFGRQIIFGVVSTTDRLISFFSLEFLLEDIKTQMPGEAAKFQTVDDLWREHMTVRENCCMFLYTGSDPFGSGISTKFVFDVFLEV